MRQIIRTVMPLNDGNIDSEGNFHNGDSVNAALEDVMTPAPSSDRCERSDAEEPASRRITEDGSERRRRSAARRRSRNVKLWGGYVGVGRAALLEDDDKKINKSSSS